MARGVRRLGVKVMGRAGRLFLYFLGFGPCIARKTVDAFLDFTAGVSHSAFRAILIHNLPPVEKGTRGLEERFLRPKGRGAAQVSLPLSHFNAKLFLRRKSSTTDASGAPEAGRKLDQDANDAGNQISIGQPGATAATYEA